MSSAILTSVRVEYAKPRSADDKRRILRESLIMTMAIRDMMHGNPKLVEAGWAEEALGFNAIAGGFQGIE